MPQRIGQRLRTDDLQIAVELLKAPRAFGQLGDDQKRPFGPEDLQHGADIGKVLGFSSAMILGIPLGMAIAEWLNWRAIFLILALLSIGGVLD